MTKLTDNNGVVLPAKIDLDAGRRAFMQSLGVGAGAVALGAAGTVAAQAQSCPSDVDILNFALNLEYLEANFYLMAVRGSGLDAADRGTNPGALSGGHKVTFKDPITEAYAREIAKDEEKHVRFLRSALGGSAVSMPAINIGTAFTVAAKAAGLISGTQTFDAYGSDQNFLLASYIFEDVGVTAYHGAAPCIRNKTYLDKAAGILAVEAYHAGIIRASLFAAGAKDATQKISALRASLGCVNDYGVGDYFQPQIVYADSDSIAFNRSTDQVLNIVYGAQGANKGLFFPNGLRGNIKQSSVASCTATSAQ